MLPIFTIFLCERFGLKALPKVCHRQYSRGRWEAASRARFFGLRRPMKAAFRPCSGQASRNACVVHGRLYKSQRCEGISPGPPSGENGHMMSCCLGHAQMASMLIYRIPIFYSIVNTWGSASISAWFSRNSASFHRHHCLAHFNKWS